MMGRAANQRRRYHKGDVIFHEGAPADHFYIVISGELDMAVTTPDGRAVRVKRLKAGDHFGYDALLADTHDTTVSCLTDVEVTAVPQDELRLASNRDTSGYLADTMKAQVPGSEGTPPEPMEPHPRPGQPVGTPPGPMEPHPQWTILFWR